MELVNAVLEHTASLIDAVLVIVILNRTFKGRDCIKQKTQITYIIVAVLYLVGEFLTDVPIIQTVIMVFVSMTYVLVVYRAKIFESIWAVVSMVIVMTIISMLTLHVISMIFGMNMNVLSADRALARNIHICVNKMMLIGAVWIYYQVKEISEFTLKRREMLFAAIYLLSTMAMAYILLYIMAVFEIENGARQGIALAMCLLLIMMGIAFVWFRYISYINEVQEKNKILDIYISEQKKSIVNSERMIEEYRVFKHDSRRYYTAILSMLEHEQYKEAIESIQGILNVGNENNHVDIKNKVIGAVINRTVDICAQKDIDIKVNVSGIIREEIELDVAVMLSNILDNAVEAEEKLHHGRIECYIFEYNNVNNIIVKNVIESSVIQGNPNLVTDKADKKRHGVGILSIKKTVEKYNGILNIEEEGGCFCVHIILPKSAEEVERNDREKVSREVIQG